MYVKYQGPTSLADAKKLIPSGPTGILSIPDFVYTPLELEVPVVLLWIARIKLPVGHP